MFLPDVNVLIYAHRNDVPEHPACAEWLSRVANGPEPFALSTLVLTAVVRIVTHPKAYSPPSTHDEVFGFLNGLTSRHNARLVAPGRRHLEIFEDLCRRSGATGKLVADAQHAAVAIEHGCTFVTADSDFKRFPGLRWRHPLRP